MTIVIHRKAPPLPFVPPVTSAGVVFDLVSA
jgi:hypothetical protein